jgi:PAS domain S-box-containing protein
MLARLRSIVPPYLGAAVAVSLAWLVRWSLGPELGEHAPFVTFVGAVLITTWLSGLGPGLFALMASTLILLYSFVPPLDTLHLASKVDVVALALYIVVVSICIGVTETLRAFHRARAEALRVSEERFRHLAEAIPSIVWTAAPDGVITYTNEKWLNYCGVTPGERPRDWPEMVLHPDDFRRCMDEWTRCLREGTAYEVEVRIRGYDGAYRWFVSRSVPWKDELGKVISWFGITIDIHEQKELQERLREADRRKDEFLATLAHELRNPLAPMRNSLEVMRLAGSRGESAEAAREIMERQLSQMVRLVDDLLDLSRITRGRIELRRSRLDLSIPLSDALETCRPQLGARHHRVEVDVTPDPLIVEGDRVRLAQVFTNLLSNACKYSPRGGEIWIRARRNGDDAVVSVKDAGIGIPSDVLPHIFDMFSQAIRSQELTDGGLGIGLCLVHGIVEQHGGKVEARSEGPGRGSEFLVMLPLSKSVPPAIAPSADGNGEAGRRRRILVADDNRDSADSLAAMLALMGHEVSAVYDGLAAVEHAAVSRPEVVLLDIGMPALDGLEAARRIRQQPWSNGVVLVALTGWGQEEDRVRAKDAGFDYHLTKPANPKALGKLICEMTPAPKSS